ncbi:MAG: collagen binding domain-containing protein, partial [Acetanaerobacterium sp.]
RIDDSLSGAGSGSTGQVRLSKVDADNPSVPLQGAVFELYNNRGGVVDSGTTDENGEILFEDLQFRNYVLKEISAPNGYLRGEEYKFRLTSDQPSGEPLEITYENQMGRGNVLVTKRSTKGSLLRGALFTLYDGSGTALATATSNSDGEVVFSDLVVGEYTIRETKAPSGYYIADTVIQVTVSIDSGANEVVVAVSTDTVNDRPKPKHKDEEPPVDEPSQLVGGVGQTLPETGTLFDTLVLILAGVVLVVSGMAAFVVIWRRWKE